MNEKQNNYVVTKEDSFECAIRLIGLGYNPVVLDFASGTNPGDGEESNKGVKKKVYVEEVIWDYCLKRKSIQYRQMDYITSRMCR